MTTIRCSSAGARSIYIGASQTGGEASLVAAAKRGQQAAFGALCEFHAKGILHTLFRITRNREDAEDALQDSFLSALVHLESFDGRSSFSTWLTRIAINSALMKLRLRFEPPMGIRTPKNSTRSKNDKRWSPEWSVICDRPFGT